YRQNNDSSSGECLGCFLPGLFFKSLHVQLTVCGTELCRIAQKSSNRAQTRPAHLLLLLKHLRRIGEVAQTSPHHARERDRTPQCRPSCQDAGSRDLVSQAAAPRKRTSSAQLL